MKNGNVVARVRYSLAGLSLLLRDERSFRAHCLASAALLAALWLSDAKAEWWGLFLIAIGCGLAGEAMNAAIERLCDRIESDHDPAIGAIKDIASAGAFAINCAIGLVALLYLGSQSLAN